MQSRPCGSKPNKLHESIQLGPVWGSCTNRSQSSSCMDLQYQYQYDSVCISMYQSLLLKYLNLFEACGLRIDIASQHQTHAICSALFLQPPQLCQLCLRQRWVLQILDLLALQAREQMVLESSFPSEETWASNSWRFRRVCQNFWVFEKDKMFAVSYWDPTRL